MNQTRNVGVRRALPLAVVLSAAALISAGPAVATTTGGDAESQSGAKPTVVLVHGAWADASSWDEVTRSLQAQGYPVVATANPLRSLSSDSDYLAARLKTIKGPVVLVGHSYGGAVISNAAVGNPNIKSLVYIAGFAPEPGETTGQLASKFPGSRLSDDPKAPIPTALNPVPLGGGPTNVDLYIKADKFSDVFLSNRLEADQAAVLAASQRPAGAATLNEPSKAAAWKTIPSWFLVDTDDRAIGTDNLRYMAKRAGGTTVEVDAAHDVMATDSAAVTQLILQAADGARPSLAHTGASKQTAALATTAVFAVIAGSVLVIRSRRI
ncbi:alpha/beta fold hydrolase [Streptomyces sp. NPDC059271]|uniref:alpha/beta fold hydrolase n=1 Tax=Streptomyces sp. NPDC059271 TaxID=3346799 RepID=UPI0036926966